MIPISPTLIGYGICIVVILVLSITVSAQHDAIKKLEAAKVLWESKNTELANRIKDQNDALRDAEQKYTKAQSALDVAFGKNQALSAEYNKLRSDWKNQPLPKTCPDSISELKVRAGKLVSNWNTK